MTCVTQIAIALSLASSLFAGQPAGSMEYVSGNAPGLPANTRGYLQLRDDNLAAFHTALGTIRLPYDRLEYSLQPTRRGAALHLEAINENGTRLSMVFRVRRPAAESIATLLKERTSAARHQAARVTSLKLESSLR